MWEYEHRIETTASPRALWGLWADVANWGRWNADIERIELRGPFATGSEITMTPAGQDPVELRIGDLVPGELFIDEAEFDGLLLRTAHRLEPVGPGRTRVVYRMEITGPTADRLGPEVGPAVTGDWPVTMAALVKAAEGAEAVDGGRAAVDGAGRAEAEAAGR
ncbi:SRPBCC family protein [Kitasatospora sp. NBC_01287]|uniref:SRPBCC family protein n=1 Tax=Kitasatospora sp. NBC_01287 TaxID=2903573 RepID=UPI00224E215E|nr:SRPBCC family protein [Kitasatospora sp. NBC_01287]MCX4750866.1 SRPBCC family protein [Kitasatospora sp. NBC_01287]